MATSLSASDYLKAARTPRMIGIFVLFLIAALVCVQLGHWQLERSLERGSAQAEATEKAQAAAAAVAIDQVLAPQSEFRAEHLGKKVRVSGTYGDQVLIPNRNVQGTPATLIVADLQTDAGAHLPVVRGWLPASQAGIKDNQAFSSIDITPPAGSIEVVGYLANSEQSEFAPAGADIAGIEYQLSTAKLANRWGTPTYTGYLVLAKAAGEPAALRLAPQPDLVKDSGRNWQNFAYAVEWFIFGGFALALWGKMVKDEAEAQRVDAQLAGE